jgi:hypothetical protein
MSARPRRLMWHLSVFGVLLVIPLVIVTGLISYFYVSQVQEAIDARGEQTVRDASRAVDREIENGILLVTVLSTSPSLAAGNFESFYGEAKRAISGRPGLQVALEKWTGESVFTTALPFGTDPKGHIDETLDSAEMRATETTASSSPILSTSAPTTSRSWWY